MLRSLVLSWKEGPPPTDQVCSVVVCKEASQLKGNSRGGVVVVLCKEGV